MGVVRYIVKNMAVQYIVTWLIIKWMEKLFYNIKTAQQKEQHSLMENKYQIGNK